MQKPQPGEKYRHYKSKGGDDHTYKVVGIAKHSESLDDLVLYKTLYETTDFPAGQIWARPLEMFTETIERDNYSGPRFKKIQ